jgi:hypothetical protein
MIRNSLSIQAVSKACIDAYHIHPIRLGGIFSFNGVRMEIKIHIPARAAEGNILRPVDENTNWSSGLKVVAYNWN